MPRRIPVLRGPEPPNGAGTACYATVPQVHGLPGGRVQLLVVHAVEAFNPRRVDREPQQRQLPQLQQVGNFFVWPCEADSEGPIRLMGQPGSRGRSQDAGCRTRTEMRPHDYTNARLLDLLGESRGGTRRLGYWWCSTSLSKTQHRDCRLPGSCHLGLLTGALEVIAGVPIKHRSTRDGEVG